MSDEKVVYRSGSGGVGFLGLLTIAFIVLKLCNVIAWSWWWVLSPLWIPPLLVFIVLLFIGIFMVLVHTICGIISLFDKD